ncbi:putative nucleotidyltransferase substrate binding domain-containing protein [Vreelandella jeotgali]|uniref:putative nucleotidyltransferase substrate binding domain-containing protein n=1 Tax=Vreelandella jeotgali TaxID=553386 RepID=UPI000370DA9D|nr:putative nucleotidyltransferase substrate binding domain-containing protein [Halomonas jeotgali]
MVEVDLSHPPFSLLDASGLERARQGLEAAHFESGDIILDTGETGSYLFLIQQGEVAEVDPTLPAATARIGLYTVGDLFGAISMINGHSRYRFIAEQDCLCYRLPRALFRQLCQACPEFDDFFRQTLANKAHRLMEKRTEGGVTMAGFMLAQVSECMRAPQRTRADADIADAVRQLNASHDDSLLVGDEQALGMVTKTDLLNALVIQQLDQQSPIGDIARYQLVTVSPGQYLFEALVLMTRHKVSRVVVMDGSRLAGVVELTDVLSYFSSRSYVVSLQVEQADDLETLADASHRTPELVSALMAQGVKLRFAMELLAALNGRIIHKAWEFCVDARYHGESCLMVMGSEGRGEQILKTDQDNGVILEDTLEWPDMSTTMQQLTDTLVRLGYPPCPGNIMVSNPEWVGSVSQWQARIQRWVAAQDGDSLMKLAIMLDAHVVAGNPTLLERVRQTLFDHCASDDLLLADFARAALRFSTPLTLFGSLKKPQHGIDIKKGGIFPIVHGVRTMALERRITATSTFDRLDALVEDGRLKRGFADDVGEALALFTELRLKRQLEATTAEDSRDRVVVQALSSLERDLLREALHIVKDLKQRLSHRYHLEYA